ncbi:PD-(D/E)XK nuclease family protein [Undibacterium fentianense]|uniref:PD-(D/E)XK nuclease family protein n=1 Tax=Undibacterium fentianense TaxID=2828728 RepID=A0A941E7K5_9BURK|nr:PD-(D/E)XK nuclease family protein [Undibacterium fentianense]MBR7800153.1 PD-(D/E)XK nuclease family protein [Undibacterium fentianense]
MLRSPFLIPASEYFWRDAARKIIAWHQQRLPKQDLFSPEQPSQLDFSAQRVVVPTFEHAQLLTRALGVELGQHFIPPKIETMFAWLNMQTPPDMSPTASSERLMRLYAELRQHGWLRKLFGARSNTELLPLAQTLLNLSDELTQVWLPKALDRRKFDTEKLMSVWQNAIAQLPAPVQELASEETKLVWTLWQAQIDNRDKTVQKFLQMLNLAEHANADLVWISPTLPDHLELAFIQAYAKRCMVDVIALDWRADGLPVSIKRAWPNLIQMEMDIPNIQTSPKLVQLAPPFDWSKLRLCEVSNLEQEAEQAAQTIVNWLQEGKQQVAVIAQDRIISRRLRALLERAGVIVADETGWKLSTTRAAASLVAWFEVVASRADTIALLDFLKTPFLSPAEFLGKSEDGASDAVDDGDLIAQTIECKADAIMDIELALRRHNVIGGWDAILSSLGHHQQAYNWIAQIARLAHRYGSGHGAAKRSVKEWTLTSLQTLTDLGLLVGLQADIAGSQIIQMLQALSTDCEGLDTYFNFNEWRAFINLQMEETPFKQDQTDQRVLMLPLNGARLRRFDAVYLIGGDASHLPSKPQETLFFTNAVRRECGLITREERQRQQLRDLAELLMSNAEVVVSWQSQINGEFNALSPWLEQVQLSLARQKLPPLRTNRVPLQTRELQPAVTVQPKPVATELMPKTLSASGFTSLMACPYQFFAGRMLKLSAIDELSDMPEKRDYGDWLHAILKNYHDRLLAEKISLESNREQILIEISEAWFQRVLKQSPAALGYSIRWRKVIPAYVAWANAREADGWQFAFGEVWAEAQLEWENGGIQLRGRLDRIDERHLDSGGLERAVLDYKTKKKSELRSRIKAMADHQLAFYGLLRVKIEPEKDSLDVATYFLDPVDSANYVALELERDQTGEVEAIDYTNWKNALEHSISQNMQAIQQGASLPAHGVDSVCEYCDVRGLCRKGAW